MALLLCGTYGFHGLNNTSKIPDIVLHDKKEKPCLLMYIVIPFDSNVNTKETEKISKYKDLWRSMLAGCGK